VTRADRPRLEHAADDERAVEILRAGGLVAFPTETVYGLGADATNPAALRRLYAVKGRPAEHPVIVHLARVEQLYGWAIDVPELARFLATACWPGPLTLVLRRAPSVPDEATGGLDTVGLRVPAHPLALELLDAFGSGIAAPSANRFGRVSPTTAGAVRTELGDDVDLVLDGGACRVGVESTIVDCSGAEPRILREGGLTRERLAELVGHDLPVGGATRAPGTLEAHYAPRARVETTRAAGLADRAEQLRAHGRRVGVLALASDLRSYPPEIVRRGADTAFSHTNREGGGEVIVTLATPTSVEEYARVLYVALRRADDLGLDVVLAVPPAGHGIGAAVADRLRRAGARR